MKYGVRVISQNDPAVAYGLHDAVLTGRGWERWASSDKNGGGQKPVVYHDINTAHYELVGWIKTGCGLQFIVEEMHQ